MPAKPTPVEAYLATLSEDKRATLETVRKAIHAAAPGAVEGVSYGMPAFILGKAIAGFVAAKDHLSYFPMSGSVVATMKDDLKGYYTSKGTIRFAVGRPLPAALIRKLVKARLAEIAVHPKAKKAKA